MVQLQLPQASQVPPIFQGPDVQNNVPILLRNLYKNFELHDKLGIMHPNEIEEFASGAIGGSESA